MEFVARDAAALAPILADRNIRVFVKGIARRADILAEFLKYKKKFDLDRFGVVLP